MQKPFSTPILFIVFNKPKQTKIVFQAIRTIKPKRLFIAADGPRSNNQRDRELIKEVRNIVKQVDWPCQVKTKFRVKNAGCKKAVSQAITWFFSNVKEGIILEDDTLPNKSFFFFTQELLRKYRHDNRVSIIGGSHPFNDGISIKDDYFFSKYTRIWGWATWRRVWEKYDVNIKAWPKIKNHKLHHKYFSSSREARHWEGIWDKCYQNKIDTWDYQLLLLLMLSNSFTAVPSKNLVSNIGFGSEATHTKIDLSGLSNFPRQNINFPLKHPTEVIPNKNKDNFLSRIYSQSKWSRIIHQPLSLIRILKLKFSDLLPRKNNI